MAVRRGGWEEAGWTIPSGSDELSAPVRGRLMDNWVTLYDACWEATAEVEYFIDHGDDSESCIGTCKSPFYISPSHKSMPRGSWDATNPLK